LPDAVADQPEPEQTPGSWMSHEKPESSVMLQVPMVGAFVRSLLPVHLEDGFIVTFGVWIAILPDDLSQAHAVWWMPEYSDLVLHGSLANALPRWGFLGAPVVSRVLDVEHTPYVTESSDDGLASVLRDDWPHDVLEGLP
jgi:hypothetical protein